jgi:hypothetical protein
MLSVVDCEWFSSERRERERTLSVYYSVDVTKVKQAGWKCVNETTVQASIAVSEGTASMTTRDAGPSCHVTRSLLITTTTYASPPSMGPARPEAGVLACRSGVSQ